jgi:hypothetical protein
LEGRKILLAVNNPQAEKWFAARYPRSDVRLRLAGDWLPDAVVVARKSRIGSTAVGLEDPVSVVVEVMGKGALPVVVVLAGKQDPAGAAAAEKARLLGIPDECVMCCSGSENISAAGVARVLENAVEKDLRPEPLLFIGALEEESGEDAVVFGKETGESTPPGYGDGTSAGAAPVNWSVLEPYRDAVTAVVAPCNGVGKTTLAAALCAHITAVGEKAALVDLDTPAMAYLHMGDPDMAERDGWLYAGTPWGELWVPRSSLFNRADTLALLGFLAQEGKRVVVDAPSGTDVEWDRFARPVCVVDGDLRVLRLCRAAGGVPANGVLAANRVPAAARNVWSSVVGEELGRVPDVVIESDFEGCQAAIEKMSPAVDSPGSVTVARGVGEIAALLGGGKGAARLAV